MRRILLLLGIAALMFVTIVQIVSAQGADIWFPDSSGGNDYARLVDPTWGLLVDDLASAGTPCVTVDSVGRFGTSTCGSVGSGFATTSADYWISQYYKGYFFSTTSADHWETTQTARTADDLTNNSIEDLSDVAAMTENFGDLLYWNGSAWADKATSTLGISWNDLANVPAGFADGVDDTSGGGTGAVATSSGETAGQLAYWTTTNGTPARLSTVATGTLTCSSGISCTQRALIGGSSAITLNAALDELTDVTTSGQAAGNILGYDGAGWVPMSTSSYLITTELDTSSELKSLITDETGGTGSVLFFNTSGLSAGQVLIWNGTDYVGMSTTSYLLSSELDTAGELETQIGSVNVLLETEIDASSELAALMDDEFGTGLFMLTSASSTLPNTVSIGSSTASTSALGNFAVTGDVKADQLFVTGATSTFANGISIAAGCVLVNGTCLTPGSGSGTVSSGSTGQATYYAADGTTVSGTSSIRFLTSDQVLRGTSSDGTARFEINNKDANSVKGGLNIYSLGTSGADYELRFDSPNPDIEFVEIDQVGTDGTGQFEIDVNNDVMRFFGRNADDSSFDPPFMALWRWADGGMVGIGTQYSTPNAKLEIVSTSTKQYGLAVGTTTGAGSGGQFNVDSDTGYVGIGQMNPVALLHMATSVSSTLDMLTLESTGAFAGSNPCIEWYNSAGVVTTARICSTNGSSYTNSNLTFHSADASKTTQERARFDVNGDFGVGTTSPWARLSAVGSGTDPVVNFASSTGTSMFRIDAGGTTTAANGVNISTGCFAVNGTCLSTSVGTIDGSGSSNRVTYWSDADTLTSDADLTFDGSRLTATNLLVSNYATTTYLVTKAATTPAIADTATYFWTDTNGFANFRTSLDDTGYFYYDGSGNELFAVDSSITAWRSLYSLDVNGTATSTFNRGINIDGTGCFAVNGVCVSGTGGTGTVNSGTQGQTAYYAGAGTAVSGTSTVFIDTDKQVGIGTTTPQEDLNLVGNFIVEGQTGSKAYRFRTTGSNLDFDAGGADLYFTNNTLPDFTGTERKYLVMGSTFDFVAAYGPWEWQDRAGGTAHHKINGEGGVIFNENGEDRDFRVESDTITHLLFTDASANRVGVGSSTPWAFLGILPDASATRPIFTAASSTGTSILEVTATGSVKINDKGILYDFTKATASSSKNSNDKFGQIAWCPNGYKAISGGHSFGTTTAGIDLGILASEPTATSGGWYVDAIETVSVTTNWDVKVTANCTRLSY